MPVRLFPSPSVAEGGFSLQDFLSFKLEIGTSEEDNVYYNMSHDGNQCIMCHSSYTLYMNTTPISLIFATAGNENGIGRSFTRLFFPNCGEKWSRIETNHHAPWLFIIHTLT